MASPSTSSNNTNRYSDFDAGINTSAAWTTSLEDELAKDHTHHFKPARALYAFDGQEEFHELKNIAAGDDLEVIKEELPDGWSLAKTVVDNSIGLIPRSYYTFTADFVVQPLNDDADDNDDGERDCPTPTPGSSNNTVPTGIEPQTTGEWRGPLESLLGGRSLNRFSNFVTSGAEAWVLNGVPTPDDSLASSSSSTSTPNPPSDDTDEEEEETEDPRKGEADRHYIDTGPSWKAKIPPFKILVHSPSKRTSVLLGSYTIYSITSLFSPNDTYDPPPTSHHNRLHSDFIPRSMRTQSQFYYGEDNDDVDAEPKPLQRITVYRRFSHFITLHNTLLRRLPGIALPPLPAKQYTNRFNSSFIEARRSDLERYLNTLIRHPIARYAEILTFFLSSDSDSDSASNFLQLLPKYTRLPPAGPQFYAQVYHPVYNVDLEDASDAAMGFAGHVKGVKKSVQGLRGLFVKVREARVEMARMERALGYAILGMITAPPDSVTTEEDERDRVSGRDGKKKDEQSKGLVNSSGAWCWRENCKECFQLTKGLQKFSDTLQSVADLYDDHARRTQLATHESLKSMAHPDTIYAPILDTHNATLSRYRSALSDGSNDPTKAELAARCETVLNTTMSEMDIYHRQKVEDFNRFGIEHLDGEIQLYEQILTRLRTARSTLVSSPSSTANISDSTLEDVIKPSIYTRDLFPPTTTTALSPLSPSGSSSSGFLPSSPSSALSSRFYPYNNSKLITTSHKFVPYSSSSSLTVNATGTGNSHNQVLGIGEVQIPSLPMPAPHVFDGVGWL